MEFDYRRLLADRRFAVSSIILVLVLFAISIHIENLWLTLVFLFILAVLFGIYSD